MQPKHRESGELISVQKSHKNEQSAELGTRSHLKEENSSCSSRRYLRQSASSRVSNGDWRGSGRRRGGISPEGEPGTVAPYLRACDRGGGAAAAVR